MKQDTSALKIFTRGKSRLQLALTTFFVLLLAISSISTLAYTYFQTSDAALRSARQMMKATNNSTYKDVLRYLGTAKRTVRAVTWSVRDMNFVREDRERLFSLLSGQLRAHREIFSISVGDSSGSVLMVGKIFDEPKYSLDKSKQLPPDVRFRAHWVDLPGRTEYYLYMNKDMDVIDRENVPPDQIKYDVKTRPWYMLAEKKKGNNWTDINLYSNGEFGVSNVEATLNAQGNVKMVVSTTIALSLHDGILSRLNVGQHGIAFVLDGDGQLIAYPERDKITHCDEATPGVPRKCKFNKVNEMGNDALAAAFENYKKKSDLKDGGSIPRRLNYLDYSRAIKRLEPEQLVALKKVYDINEIDKTILVKADIPADVRATVPDILDSIGYTYNIRFKSGSEEYLASFHDFPDSYGKSWMIGVLVPINDFIGPLKNTILQVAIISIGILVISIGLIVLVAHRVLKPLKLIAQDMNRIQALDIDETVSHASFFYEIALIANALASMKHGLKAFSKFVPFTLVKQLIASGNAAELGGEKRHLTMMFTDIEGFTTISESLSTEQLLQHISEYLDSLTKIILNQHGTVDKYIGDAIMCFWGAPLLDPDQEYHACKTALLCISKLRELNSKWVKEGKPALNTRFGIASGDVSVGNMGSSDRMNYTVLGDSVNLAARLEGINKYYGTDIIVSESTFAVVKDRFLFRPLDVVAVKGKTRGVVIYQLLGEISDPETQPAPDVIQAQKLTEQGFNAFMNRDFETALATYSELAKRFPHDPLGKMFLERCQEYLNNPPGADWDGVTHMKTK
ncbi:MAG: adenylate/guanylate cyclase domain-containing protein [Spirochaetia bacterium]|nr:adenylate/guanylate cyclase domain-containing protein [Spirochaetia bacterium]